MAPKYYIEQAKRLGVPLYKIINSPNKTARGLIKNKHRHSKGSDIEKIMLKLRVYGTTDSIKRNIYYIKRSTKTCQCCGSKIKGGYVLTNTGKIYLEKLRKKRLYKTLQTEGRRTYEYIRATSKEEQKNG